MTNYYSNFTKISKKFTPVWLGAISMKPCSLAQLVVTITLLAVPSASSTAPQKLNVLLLIADDLRPLEMEGSPRVIIPNMQSLLTRPGALHFKRAHAQYPVCTASRASFLTSRYPDR